MRRALLAQLGELAAARLDERRQRLALAPPVLDLALAVLDLAAQREQRLAALGEDPLALAELEPLGRDRELALGELGLVRGRGVALALEALARGVDRPSASSRRSSAASDSSSTRSVSRSRL